MIEHSPAETQYTMNGLSYKIGLHGVIFVWIDGRWIRSSKTKADLEGKKNSRFFNYDN